MNDGRIATRYARALLRWANDHGQARELYDASVQLSPVLLDQAMSLSHMLGSAVITKEKKLAFADRFFSPQAEGLRKLADLMIQKGRGYYLARSILVYADLYRQQEEIVHVDVHSAHDLEDAEKARLSTYLKSQFGDKVEMGFHQSSSLIGGFQLYVAGKRYDKSVRGELTRMALAMRE